MVFLEQDDRAGGLDVERGGSMLDSELDDLLDTVIRNGGLVSESVD